MNYNQIQVWNGDDEYSPYLTVFKYEHFYFWFEQNDCGLIEDLMIWKPYPNASMMNVSLSCEHMATDDNILDDFDKYIYEHFF